MLLHQLAQAEAGVGILARGGQPLHAGRGWRRRIAQDLFKDPLAAPDRAGAGRTRSDGQDAGHRQHPPAVAIGELDLAHGGSGDVGDAIVLGQAFIEEGIVAVEEFDDAAVLAHHRFEEHGRLIVHRLAQRLVEVREFGRIGFLVAVEGCASQSTLLRAEVSTRAWDLGLWSIRLVCLSRVIGSCSLPSLASLQQLVVGQWTTTWK